MFKYYSDTVRPTDQEIITIEKIVTHSFQKEGTRMPSRAMWEAPGK